MIPDFRNYVGGYTSVIVDPNELYHHGRLHQKWGVRNGPPYPLTLTAKRSAGYTGKKLSRKERKANEASEKARLASEQRQRAAAEEIKRRKEDPQYEEKKKLALDYGTAEDVLRFKGDLTNNELQNALNRINMEIRLSEQSRKDREAGWTAVNNLMNHAKDINNWTSTGITAYENFGKIKKFMDDASKKAEEAAKKK